eukprot:41666_1
MMLFIYYLLVIPTVFADKFSHCESIGRCYQECGFTSTESECDTLPPIPSNEDLNGEILIYRTSHSNEKFNQYKLQWNKHSNKTNNTITLTIDSNKKYQQIVGFGAAFTDAVVFNLNKMQNIASSEYNNINIIYDILYSYFSWNDTNKNNFGGLGYLYGRIPIASCDFSPYSYTYLPVKNDFDLTHFSLTQQDFGNKSNPNLKFGRFDIIHTAQQIINNTNNNHKLHLFATPWTAPPWLKVDTDTDKDPNGYIQGHLNPNKTYWKTYSDYFIKYIDAYKQLGNIEIEAVTPQNEPHAPSSWESMVWNDEQLMTFISEYLGPKLRNYNSNIQLWIHDGQKVEVPEDVLPYFMLNSVSKYINGIGMHWYMLAPPTPGCPNDLCTGSFNQINEMYDFIENYNKEKNENIFLINTEACTGFNIIESPPVRGVSLGDWNRGMQYAEDIIGDIQNGLSGWIDWNFILDINGGPNHVNNTCDAPIIVDFNKQKYYKQPMYYHMAHITRFMLRYSYRIHIINDKINENLWFTAVIDEKELDKTIIVLLNTNSNTYIDIEIYDNRKGFVNIRIPPHSIQTVLYQN